MQRVNMLSVYSIVFSQSTVKSAHLEFLSIKLPDLLKFSSNETYDFVRIMGKCLLNSFLFAVSIDTETI